MAVAIQQRDFFEAAAQAVWERVPSSVGSVLCIEVVIEEGHRYLDAAMLPLYWFPDRENTSFEELFVGIELPINLEEVLDQLNEDLRLGALEVPEEWLEPLARDLQPGWTPIRYFYKADQAPYTQPFAMAV